jgi:hypothetical protein
MEVKFVFFDLVRIGFRMGLVSEREARLDLLRVGSPGRGGVTVGRVSTARLLGMCGNHG